MFTANHNVPQQPITIVGNGLAGSLLAWTLLEHGANIQIYGDKQTNASRVAAGIINPVIGQRFTLAEHTPNMLAFAGAFYRNIEKSLHISCYHPTPMQRLFSSQKEQGNCKRRQKNVKYASFFTKNDISSRLHAEHSGVVQQQTAWLDTNILLDALHLEFERKNIIHYNTFTPHASNAPTIYCEGYQMKDNPLFSWLPLQPAHGEIITCSTEKALPHDIINKSKWLLPTDEHSCRIGATYDTHISAPTVQATSKHQLLTFAHQLFKTNPQFKVIQHQAGIRPTTLDKQPFIGLHPKHQNNAIFNGFGSRGSLMIPWYADLLVNNATPSHADIQRYTHLCV